MPCLFRKSQKFPLPPCGGGGLAILNQGCGSSEGGIDPKVSRLKKSHLVVWHPPAESGDSEEKDGHVRERGTNRSYFICVTVYTRAS